MQTVDQKGANELCLKELCLQAVRKHFPAVGPEAVVQLPVVLLKDLVPHLTVCQLNELQPALNLRQISTYPGWSRFLEDIFGRNRMWDFRTEESAKHEVMRLLFLFIFYGFQNAFTIKNTADVNNPSFLWTAAKCIRKFSILTPSEALERLITEQRPLLDLLEKSIRTVALQSFDLSKKGEKTKMFIVHRLLDHGGTKEVIVYHVCPKMLAWIICGRGSKNVIDNSMSTSTLQAVSSSARGTTWSSEAEATPCKRRKWDYVSKDGEEADEPVHSVESLCEAFTLHNDPSAVSCPRGQIEHLEVRRCQPDSLKVIISALPTWFCLHSLILHSSSFTSSLTTVSFDESDVLRLARALKQLSMSSCSRLSELSVSILPDLKLMPTLLDSSPNLLSLHVEIHTLLSPPEATWSTCAELGGPGDAAVSLGELRLQKLTVKLVQDWTDVQCITSILRRSPHLCSLHMSGLRLPNVSLQSQLLTTLSEANQSLKVLSLEDMNLSACLPDIIHLLGSCTLEELQINDCRLLEKWSNIKENLRLLVSALTTVPTLHTVSLAQNRLSKNVCVLAELFSGSTQSSVKVLNISSNFIQPADLLVFANTLTKHPPLHQLTLDLRKNPSDRQPDVWNAALKKLQPFCILLAEEWKSTHAMVDHVSNM